MTPRKRRSRYLRQARQWAELERQTIQPGDWSAVWRTLDSNGGYHPRRTKKRLLLETLVEALVRGPLQRDDQTPDEL